MSTLDDALADLAQHPNSSAREIAQRIGADDKRVFRVLNNAAYDYLCQRRQLEGQSVWRWEISQPPGNETSQ